MKKKEANCHLENIKFLARMDYQPLFLRHLVHDIIAVHVFCINNHILLTVAFMRESL